MPIYALAEPKNARSASNPGDAQPIQLTQAVGAPDPGPAEEVPVTHSWEQQLIVAVRGELDGYLVSLKQLNRMEQDQVFMTLSSISARLVELRVQLVRSPNRRLQALRTKEVDPMLDEIDRQFKLHSRILAVKSLDWELAKGQL